MKVILWKQTNVHRGAKPQPYLCTVRLPSGFRLPMNMSKAADIFH
jgi:hypothetical protein